MVPSKRVVGGFMGGLEERGGALPQKDKGGEALSFSKVGAGSYFLFLANLLSLPSFFFFF